MKALHLLLLPAVGAFAFTTTETTLPTRCSSRSADCCIRVGLAADDGAADLLTRSEAVLRALAWPLAGAATFRAGAAAAVIGQPRLPSSLPGPYKFVGSRIVRVSASGGGARVRLFYPCEEPPLSGIAEAPYCTDGRATSDSMSGLVGFRQLGLSFLLAHLANASSGCYMNSPPIISPKDPLPLLAYSHGYGGNFDMAAFFLRAVASTGVVVAAVEHTDGTASMTTLVDGGTQLPFSPSLLSGRKQLVRRASELLAASDPSCLPDDLPINPNSVFLGGHSYGAPSALLAAATQAKGERRRPPIAGLILHDPALGMGQGMLAEVGPLLASTPTISYTSDEYNRAGVRYGDLTVHVRGAFHGNFVDAPLWAPSWVMRPLSAVIPAAGPADPVHVHEALAQSVAAFAQSREAAFGTPTGTDDTGIFELIECM